MTESPHLDDTVGSLEVVEELDGAPEVEHELSADAAAASDDAPEGDDNAAADAAADDADATFDTDPAAASASAGGADVDGSTETDAAEVEEDPVAAFKVALRAAPGEWYVVHSCLLYTSDAADE